ncbi:MAG: hypothetical protein ABR946_10620 [Solirubrobacteraceae bacterium]
MRHILRPRRVTAVLALLACLVVGISSGAAAKAVVSPRKAAPGSDARGLALLAAIDNAYTRVAGVEVRITLRGKQLGSFTDTLRGGSVVAEQFVAKSSVGTTMLVAPHGSPTFAREPGTSCWRILLPASPQALSDVGHPFLVFAKDTVVHRPTPVANGLESLDLVEGTTSVALTVEAKTLLVARMDARMGSEVAEDSVTNLSAAPKLLIPRPLCTVPAKG